MLSSGHVRKMAELTHIQEFVEKRSNFYNRSSANLPGSGGPILRDHGTATVIGS